MYKQIILLFKLNCLLCRSHILILQPFLSQVITKLYCRFQLSKCIPLFWHQFVLVSKVFDKPFILKIKVRQVWDHSFRGCLYQHVYHYWVNILGWCWLVGLVDQMVTVHNYLTALGDTVQFLPCSLHFVHHT